MSQSVDAFFAPIVADLRDVVGLLDPGVAPSQSLQRGADAPGTLSGLLDDIDSLTGLVPRLVADLEGDPAHVDTALEHSPVPRRPLLSKCARDYVPHGGSMVPRTWFNAVPVLDVDSRPLSYVLWLAERLVAKLADRRSRLDEVIREALSARVVDSVYAREEAAELRRTEDHLEHAAASLRRAASALLRHASGRLVPSPQRPSPYPRGHAWTALRRVADLIERPGVMTIRDIRAALRAAVHVADRGFLFQRWIGLKIVALLEASGWQVRGDKIGALLLGGELRLQKASTRISLWVELRVRADDRHESGLRATVGEATPDFVFLTPGPHGQDAFVLDPTLSADPGHLETKSRYLELLEFVAPARIAGVPVRRPPERSWAIAPSRRTTCDLHSRDGARGAVPIWPGESELALRAWLGDVEAHAVAWT